MSVEGLNNLNESVLLVDDEPEILDVLSDLIRAEGFQVRTASNGKAALVEIEKETPFLVLSDFKMPHMDGLVLLRKIREKNVDLPFALMTAHAEKAMAIEGVRLGALEIIEKPCDSQKILDLIVAEGRKRLKSLEREDRENQELREIFFQTVDDLLTDIEPVILRLESEGDDRLVVDALFRKIHTIKGGAGAIPQGEALEKLTHRFESSLSLLRKGKLRVDSKIVDAYLAASDLTLKLVEFLRQNQIPDEETAELVEQQIKLFQKVEDKNPQKAREITHPGFAFVSGKSQARHQRMHIAGEKFDRILLLIEDLKALQSKLVPANKSKSKTLNLLQEKVEDIESEFLSIKQISFEKLMNRIPRLFRETALRLGKKVRLDLSGPDIRVDQNVAKLLNTVLIHLMNNALDHGIEDPVIRTEKGKAETGLVRIQASEDRDVLRVEIEDDGKGFSRQKILKKALGMKMVSAEDASLMTDEEVFELVFSPGFTTRKRASGVSGRGVGMDVVRTTVEKMGGRVWVQPRLGGGTRVVIALPVLAKTVKIAA